MFYLVLFSLIRIFARDIELNHDTEGQTLCVIEFLHHKRQEKESNAQ